jgi:hypothetical protein
VEQAREDGAGVLAHVAGLRVSGDVDDHRGQAQDLLEQQLHQVGLAAAGRSDQQRVALGQQLLALRAVQVDALDAPDVAVRHQRDGPARLALAAVAELVQTLEDRFRREAGEILDEFDEVLEAGFPVLLERLHESES